MTNEIHLQGIGKHRAKPAQEFNIGDIIVYNYGETAKVVSSVLKGKSIHLDILSKGKLFKVRKTKTTLMGYR